MIIQANTKEKEQLARLMRAEAVGEGDLGMLMVGNVVVNRALADCLTFGEVNTLYDVMFQPNQFAGTLSPLFYGNPNSKEKKLVKRVIKGEYFWPATNALWFYAPRGYEECRPTWFDQDFVGRFKGHCFYIPDYTVCRRLR